LIVEFGVLGPVQVRVGGQEGTPVGTRLRLLLAMLLLHANLTVPSGVLVQAMWDEDPTESRQAALPTYVMRLRRALGTQAAARVVTRPGGYGIELGPDELDALRFQRLWDDGRAQAQRGDLAAAHACLSAALELWRGEPLATLPAGRVVASQIARLNDRRLAAQRDLIDVGLKLGRHAELLPDIAALAARHPFDEDLHGQWMLALYRSGRQSDALRVFADLRRELAEQVGLDPGAALLELHQRILTGDPALIAERPPIVPRQLPAGLRTFVGRSQELVDLAALVADDGGVIAISAIGGTAGVGKTTLAVHFGHSMADRYPDGQLFANLRGFDPSGEPADVATVAHGFLVSLGIPPAQIPADLDARLALYRSRLAGTRTLIVLDNARDADQVRPLLPGGARCLVLVTSRVRLTGLVVRDGAVPMPLDVLSAADGGQLLARRLGAARVAAEPEAAAELVTLCAGLPLAIGVAAARAALRPAASLADICADLRAARLDALAAGDADVRAVLSWSVRALPERSAKLFRLLGVHPINDISEYAVADLYGTDVAHARSALSELVDAHLVTECAPGRFTQHDLLRDYSVELAGPQPEAVGRMVEHYIRAARRAATALYSSDHSFVSLSTVEPMAREDALAWFAAEHRAATAVLGLAAPNRAWPLAASLVGYLHRAGLWEQWEAVAHTALAAASVADDITGQAHALRWLGEVRRSQADFDTAHERLAESLALFARTGDRRFQAVTLLDIALTHGEQARNGEAVAVSQQALALFDADGDRTGKGRALNSIGWYLAQTGDHAEAIEYCERGLELAREAADRRAEAAVLDSIGFAHHHLGDFADAIVYFEQSRRIRQSVGDYFLQAETLTHLGDSHLALGDRESAEKAWRESLAILDSLRHRDAAGVRARLEA
jgi:DNA-binding SARP family transcriptional activator/tetratricopeptide (TPR) repeat protein